MIFDKSKFDNHPYINCCKHSTLDLYLYNYSQECQFEDKWDEYTLMARGLVLDSNGNAANYPMKKFFNYGQGDLKIDVLPKETPNVTLKYDGSLIGICSYNNQIIVHTRGSFTSDQAVWSKKWLDENHKGFKVGDKMSFWFECIYPENRIVVDYGNYKGLKMITIFNKETGIEWEYEDMVKCAAHYGFDFVYEKKISHIRDLLKIVENLGPNEEGFVCRYSNGLRMKIKGAEYVELHKLFTGLSNKSIWKHLSLGLDVDAIIAQLPDELFNWAVQVGDDLKKEYEEIEIKCLDITNKISGFDTQKQKAEYILNNHKKVSGIVFNMLKGKEYKEQIWDMIKPEYEKFKYNFNKKENI